MLKPRARGYVLTHPHLLARAPQLTPVPKPFATLAGISTKAW